MFEMRSLPLTYVARPGRFGAASAFPGVVLSIEHPTSLVQVIARRNYDTPVAQSLQAMKVGRVMSAGPSAYYIYNRDQAEGSLFKSIKATVGDAASVIDQSHGRVVIVITGPKARAVLAKGMPVDLHDSAFAIGHSAQTQMAHVGVHITRTDENVFMLSVFRGFSESLWQWLCLSSAEYGYEVK